MHFLDVFLEEPSNQHQYLRSSVKFKWFVMQKIKTVYTNLKIWKESEDPGKLPPPLMALNVTWRSTSAAANLAYPKSPALNPSQTVALASTTNNNLTLKTWVPQIPYVAPTSNTPAAPSDSRHKPRAVKVCSVRGTREWVLGPGIRMGWMTLKRWLLVQSKIWLTRSSKLDHRTEPFTISWTVLE